ncbi:MAG: bifunctional DNA-formamidopyrimidine glycosylase/DNA-(apurinic or apyrimidinic site) lyase [Truepera sp.]|nr:bifunctional DNA-formamidopyrimidine glycosylase/DNA-(apurinic or apyrimidinic site) lyase [Truepera sp.]
MKGRSAIPELPEVETVRLELAPWLTSAVITGTALMAPPGPKYAGLERAVGRRITAVNRRGKFLLLPLDSGDELVIHLGMTGVLSPQPGSHLRVKLELDTSPSALYFRDARRFGRFLVVPAGDYTSLPTLAALGPEPLGPDFYPARFAKALRVKTAIKTHLLSQRPVAGVGNIYADEALWRARLHPLTPSAHMSARSAARLCQAIKGVLSESLEARGTTLSDYRTVNGAAGGFGSFLQVYGRAGEPCLRCGRTIERLVVAGRGTHHCPRCQQFPAQFRPTRL